MIGVGRAGGAGTIVNAMATGRGVAFGLDLKVEVRVAPAARWSVYSLGARLGPARARLAALSAQTVSRTPLRIDVDSEIPPERGLKTSSAVAVATIRAALKLAGRRWSDGTLLDAAADAGIRSGTSITGAYDDAAACLFGGVVFTDNRQRRLLARRRLPPKLVALVHMGGRALPTARVRGTDFEPIRALVHDAEQLARKGDVRSAMLLNTAAYAPLFGHRASFTTDLVRRGAYAAGLSGKGPAEIAIVDRGLARRALQDWRRSVIVPLRNRRIP